MHSDDAPNFPHARPRADHRDVDSAQQFAITLHKLKTSGWQLEIDLTDTDLAGRNFGRWQIQRSEHDRLDCWIQHDRFCATCATTNLAEVLNAFINWAC